MAEPLRLIVTFDIVGAKGGDKRYKIVDRYLSSIGELTNVFKQVRLVETRFRPEVIAPQITRIIGPKGSVLVVQAARPFRYVLGKENKHAAKRPSVNRWLKQTRSLEKRETENVD